MSDKEFWRQNYELFKVGFYRERLFYNGARCDICGTHCPSSGSKPHHAIIRQGQSMGMDRETREMIRTTDWNCNLVHHSPCHNVAHANPRLCVAILIGIHSWNFIDGWVKNLPFKVPFEWHRGLTEEEALELVKEKAPWVLLA